MPNRQNQHGVLTRKPTILGDISVASAREDELPPTLLGFTTQQWMIGQQLEGATHAQELFAGADGVLFSDEIEEALQIPQGTVGYFDARHARALGRRALSLPSRFSR